MATLKKYINAADKNKWVQLVFVSECIEHIISRKEIYSPLIIQQLEDVNQRLIKTLNLAATHYPELKKYISNTLNDMQVLWIPKRNAQSEFRKKEQEIINEMKQDPIDILYDYLDIAYSNECKNCTRCKEECWIYKQNKMFDMPIMDNKTKDCEYKF